ncbi:MAG: saccharopine dehydrogenase family protein [Vicingaceae bacterium]
MSKIVVLGAGMVGSAMALDLSNNHKVTITDINQEALKKLPDNLSKKQLDVTKEAVLKSFIKDFDLVVCAVPGFLGFNTLKSIIESKKNVVDISFFPENALDLNELAIQNNVTAIVDCGVAPGMDNLILGYHNKKMKVNDFECLVGGLPKEKKWPFCYKAPFSPIDVIEEYTRPARYVENGNLIVKEALSDCEYVEFEKIGTLESFNSDGLRSLIFTMSHIPNMKEKTLRYPGHVEYIKVLKSTGFFDEHPIIIGNTTIKPIDFTNKILFKEWYLKPEEEEFTVMRVTVKGEENGKTLTYVYDLYDEYCKSSKTSSMARTTGYTATAAANMFLEGLFQTKGIIPPELVGENETCFKYFLQYLEERGVVYKSKLLIN